MFYLLPNLWHGHHVPLLLLCYTSLWIYITEVSKECPAISLRFFIMLLLFLLVNRSMFPSTEAVFSHLILYVQFPLAQEFAPSKCSISAINIACYPRTCGSTRATSNQLAESIPEVQNWTCCEDRAVEFLVCSYDSFSVTHIVTFLSFSGHSHANTVHPNTPHNPTCKLPSISHAFIIFNL